MPEEGLRPPAAAWRHTPLRPSLALGRCERCRRLSPVTRRSRLCPSCVAWDRAIAQATDAEPHVRARLYPPRRAVDRGC